MKTRITILAENNQPLSILGDNPEIKVKRAWKIFFDLIQLQLEPKNDDTYIIEKVEVEE